MSDLEAMGARPVGLVMALTVPSDLDATWVSEFSFGVREECANAGVLLLGGDTTRGRGDITATATVFGDLQGRPPVTRPARGPATWWRYAGGSAGRRPVRRC